MLRLLPIFSVVFLYEKSLLRGLLLKYVTIITKCHEMFVMAILLDLPTKADLVKLLAYKINATADFYPEMQQQCFLIFLGKGDFPKYFSFHYKMKQ